MIPVCPYSKEKLAFQGRFIQLDWHLSAGSSLPQRTERNRVMLACTCIFNDIVYCKQYLLNWQQCSYAQSSCPLPSLTAMVHCRQNEIMLTCKPSAIRFNRSQPPLSALSPGSLLAITAGCGSWSPAAAIASRAASRSCDDILVASWHESIGSKDWPSAGIPISCQSWIFGE